MQKPLILLLCCLSFTLLAEQKIYRVIDKHGNVSFSDKPQQGAEEVKVSPGQTYTAPEYSSMLPKEDEQANEGYELLEITSPKHEQVFAENEAKNINVSTQVKPVLKEGHQLVISLNGKPIEGNVLKELSPGPHTLEARIQNDKAETVTVSKAIQVIVE